MTRDATVLQAALLSGALILTTAACDRENLPAPSPTPAPRPAPPPAGPPSPTGFTLSGQVFDLTPEGRVPAADVPLLVTVKSSNCPGNPCSNWLTRVHASTGADGSYSVSELPPGSATLVSLQRTHRQVCGAFALKLPARLDMQITSNTNPQPSPTLTPLRLTGQVYETTPTGRVAVGGALIWFDWFYETGFYGVQADQDGHYSACGIPANWQLGVGAWQLGFWESYRYQYFAADATLDIEMYREQGGGGVRDPR